MGRVVGWVVGGLLLAVSGWLFSIRSMGPSSAAWIAFSSNRNGRSDLYQIHASGGGLRQLTHATSNEVFPSWSSDGDTILFSSDTGGYYQLYRLDWRRLTLTSIEQPQAVDNMMGNWSPDGRQVVFASNQADGSGNLYILPSRGGIAQQLTDTPDMERSPQWSPDGQWILLGARSADGSKLYRIAASGGVPERLTARDDGSEHSGAWSPDGRWIIYLGAYGDEEQGIYRIPATGGTPKRLINMPAQDWPPVYSPDGGWIAFVAAQAGNFDIYRIKSDGTGEPLRLTTHPAYDGAPTWSPVYNRDWHAGWLMGAGGLLWIGTWGWGRWRRASDN